MAFKMNGFSGFSDKIKIARAKRLIKKHVGSTTQDGPDAYSDKAERKIIKADKLLSKAGYSLEQREEAGGAEGYGTAIAWTKKKKKKK